MDASSPEVDAMARSATQEASGAMHGSAMAAGAVAGTFVVAMLAGSLILVLVLAAGAFAGAVVVGLVSLAVDRVRGRRDASGDHNMPGLTAGGGPASQRAEAGHTSPSSS